MGASLLPLLLLPLVLPRAGRPLAPTAMAPPLPRTIPSSIGLNTFFFNEGPYASEEELSVLAASGATYVRNEMVWREIEHAEGHYDWTLMDDLTAALARHRLKGMFLFGPEPPALYNLSGTCPHTPSQRAAFARWAGAAMRRYGGQGHLWEILNEPLSFWRCETGAPPDRWCACTGAAAPPGCPSCGGGWNSTFCRELFRDITDLHLAITAAAPPGEYLIGGGVSQAVFDCDKDQTFLQYLLSAPPLLERWDAVSVHAYRDPACTAGSFDPETAIDSFAATFERIRRMAPATRQRPPVALIQSEWGYASNAYDPTHGKVGPLESTPAMQASYLARSYLVTALANVSVHFWYAWLDCVITPPIAPPPPPGALPPAAVVGKCNYSSVGYDPRPTVWDVAVKPSYLALRTIATGLRGLRCVGRLPTVNGTADDFIVGFAAPAAAAAATPPHMAAWTRRNTTQTVALEGQAASFAEVCFQVEGTLGQPRERVCTADGVLVLSLTRDPIYLHRALLQAQTVAIRPPPTAAVAGLKMDGGVAVRVKADDDEIQLDTHKIEPHNLVDNADFSDPQQLKELFGAVASKLAKLEKENVALHIRTRVLEAENKEVRSELAQVRKDRDKHENATQVIATDLSKGRSETTRIRGAGEVSVSSTTINVQDYGAVGDGITDDTVAIQNALNAAGAKTVTFPGGSYLTSSTLTIPSSTSLMCHSATLTGNTGATPYFQIRQGAISVSINGGSFYNINASAFVKATGTFSTNGRYSRQLRFDGVWLETAATTVAFDFSNGVRQAYWSNCFIQANNGFSLVDNIVECSITNSLIFHSGASKVGTAGFYISTTRPNGENEGICVTNCHVDFFEKGFIISDCFIFTISQGYYGGEEMAFDYMQPSVPGNGLSYHTFSGASINQGSHLGPFSGGRAIRFNFNGCSFSTNTRVSLMFDENAYKASVTGCTFSSAAGNATHAVVVNNNAGGIVVQGCSIDETYPNGIAILGNSGLYPNVIRDNDYRGPGNLLPIVQRPTVLANNMIAGSLDGAEAMSSYQVAGTNVGNNTAVFSAGRNIAKGVRGVFQGTIHYTCTSAGAIRLATPPSQTRWPNGTGWDAQEFTVPAAVSTVQTATFSVPFYTTAELLDSVPFQIRWEGSGTMSVAPNSWALLKSDDGELVHAARSAPALPIRAIYYNLGFGLNYGNAGLNASVKICASNFDAGDWEVTLDRLVLAQYTDVYFNLWGDTELVFAGSNASYQGIGRAEQSLRLRRSLQQMIPAAHKRSLRVTLMITPTLIPNDIFHSIASKARADIVYAQPAGGGFSVVCPAVQAELQWKNRTWGSTMQLIRELYREQFRAFSEVDFVATWFYDPGGCMCGLHRHNCRGMQAERMLGLVSAMKEEAAAAIPNLRRVDVDTWATWVFEGGKGTPPLAPRPYRNEFFDELKAVAATWRGLETPMVLDTVDDMASTWGSGSTLPNARARGFNTSGFLFGTNPESGYSFWMPSLRYLAGSYARGVAWGVTGLHTYRFEEATKSPQTFIAGLIFAGRSVPEAVEGMCSYAVASDDRPNRVEACVHGVMLLENFTIRGRTRQNMTQQGAAVRAAFDAAMPASEAPRAPAYLDMADVLRTTGRAMALLGAGVDAAAANDTALDSRLKGEFVELARSSAVFESFGWDAAGAAAKWPAYKTFLAGGWACADARLGQTCF